MVLAKPVKCIPSVTTTSLILHGLSFGWSCFGIYKDRTVYILPIFFEYGGRFQYLTMITAYFCWIANGIAFLIDLIQMMTGAFESPMSSPPEKRKASFMIKLRDDLMSFWTFVLSTFVVLLYWGIAAVDLEGLHPEEHRKITPLFGWYNQYLHTTPIVITFIQIMYINYQYCGIPKALFFTATLGISYISWITHLAKVKGYWAYGFMDKQTQGEFVVFVIACHMIFFSIYLIGRKIASSVWNEDYRDKMMKAKKM